MPYLVQPVDHPLAFAIRPPGSKSITNRAFICAALADGESTLRGALTSEDTQVMAEALEAIGLSVLWRDDQVTIRGSNGEAPIKSGQLHCANSGTSIRFLTAALAALGGEFQLDGIARMRQRPIADLAAALRALGADVTTADNGCPPVGVHTTETGLRGGDANVMGNISSQFLSALLMAAPLAQQPARLQVDGELVSKPYVEMTVAVMQSFGVTVDCESSMRRFVIKPQPYQATQYDIEPDASAASYFWGAAAICGGKAAVEGLTFKALQGDVQFCRVLERMGCISDTVQTLAAVALFAEGETTIRGVAHNRHKETDRIADVATELRKLGAEVQEREDGMRIVPPATIQPAEIETYNDHRMAMSFALVGLKAPNISIRNPGCTGKTYPDYWKDLESVTRSQ